MHRINAYIDDNSFETLKKLPTTMSENIRTAIYEYLRKLSELKVSASQSKKGAEDE